MCGIAGYISKDWSAEWLPAMGAAISHRGPDAYGEYCDSSQGVYLAHRRLSILDLSEAANQPFRSRDGRYMMVFNGEVYNFGEVAAKYHIDAVTSSDTEIILEAFAKVGMDCISDLNGMFAIAIWDQLSQTFYLVRDRLGIKPLYYYWKDGSLAFASELKAIVSLPVDRSIDRGAISNYLHVGYVPGSSTIYKFCGKLRPGEYMTLSKGSLHRACYWRIEDKVLPSVVSDFTSAKSTLKSLLVSSVDYCMVSDVPLGILLSGGVDSSAVAAIAQSLSRQKVKTFSIGFNEKKFNESKYAREVSRVIGSEHHEYVVSEKDALNLVDRLLDIYDEPYADSSAIPTLMVSELARKEVKVVLSGDGGDELFMGYGFYYWARRFENPWVRTFRKPLALGLNAFGDNRMKRGSKMFGYPSIERIRSHIFSQEQYLFSESEIAALLKNPVSVSFDEGIDSTARSFSLPEAQSFFDMKNYLPEELLVKIDRASMYHALETRVPFLDHRVVEFALNLSDDLKLKGDIGKYLLKEVLYDYVPASYFDRPKWGFAVPMENWLKGDLRYLLDLYLSDEAVGRAGLVNMRAVKNLKRDFLSGRGFLYNRLWALVILHKWILEKAS